MTLYEFLKDRNAVGCMVCNSGYLEVYRFTVGANVTVESSLCRSKGDVEENLRVERDYVCVFVLAGGGKGETLWQLPNKGWKWYPE